MTLCRYLACLLLFGFLLVPTSQAQFDDVDFAPSYQLIAGRLSVTFADTVSEATALSSLKTLGYEVVQHDFAPVSVMGLMDEMLSDDALDTLKTHPLIESVQQIDVAALRKQGLEKIRQSDPELHRQIAAAFADKPEQTPLIFRLSPTLTTEQAAALATSLVPAIAIEKVEKRPNEAVIAVEEGTEEDAIAQIDVLPEVRYVAYINAN
ncbi:MAG TPA: hypothetical protein VKP65_10300 [Rhodothermales bacterium]|nr:hypothetical protein [Rhodothermales bacterium]